MARSLDLRRLNATAIDPIDRIDRIDRIDPIDPIDPMASIMLHQCAL
jgi:hypothetical protein